jgi:diguanylate cyclase (GGDEF)-like protein
MKTSVAELIANLLLDKHRLECELRTDEITGLGNLKALRETLSKRQNGNFSILFIDIDFFKSVNELHGHMAATQVLKDFGRMLGTLAANRGKCAAFRYAGDEFVLILEGSDQHIIHERAEEIRKMVESRVFRVDGHQGRSTVKITVSIGCRSTQPGETTDQILSDADKALFEAKRKSRNVSVAYAA